MHWDSKILLKFYLQVRPPLFHCRRESPYKRGTYCMSYQSFFSNWWNHVLWHIEGIKKKQILVHLNFVILNLLNCSLDWFSLAVNKSNCWNTWNCLTSFFTVWPETPWIYEVHRYTKWEKMLNIISIFFS